MVTEAIVALRTTCIKNVKFKIIKIRTRCQSVGFFCYIENLNWAAQNLRLGLMRPEGRGLGIASLVYNWHCKFQPEVTLKRSLLLLNYRQSVIHWVVDGTPKRIQFSVGSY